MEGEIEKRRREMDICSGYSVCLMHSPYSCFICCSQSSSSSLPHPHAGQPWASQGGGRKKSDRKATAVVSGGRDRASFALLPISLFLQPLQETLLAAWRAFYLPM